MGVAGSKYLSELSSAELETLIAGLGVKFEAYAKSVKENAVDGALLSMLDEESFAETLQELGISSVLHQRVLTKEWKTRILRERRSREEPPSSTPPSVSSGTRNRSAAPVAIEQSRADVLQYHPEFILQPVSINLPDDEKDRLLDVVATYDLSEATDDAELVVFDRIADKALKECDALFAGVHLFDEDGHVALSTRARCYNVEHAPCMTRRIHSPKEVSLCYRAILEREKGDSFVVRIGAGTTPFNRPDRESRYLCHIVKSREGMRIASVCVIVDSNPTKDPILEEETKAMLRELAADAEQHLELRRVLLARNNSLQDQISGIRSKYPAVTEIVLPSFGPVRAVTQSDLRRHEESPFPTQEQVLASGKPARTAMLPIFHDSRRASAQEMSHLPDDYYDFLDAMGSDRTPVHRNDMERVAVVESLGLKDIPHNSQTGVALQRLTELAAQLFDCDYTEIGVMVHDKHYNMANYYACSSEVKTMLAAFKKPLSYTETGQSWLCASDRGPSVCNYAAYTGRTFTTNDAWGDESLSWVRDMKAFRFYSSSPIFVNGHVVANFCIYDFRRPHPEFGEANQMQQEQLCQMAGALMENWGLHREMEQTEQGWKQLELPFSKSTAPELDGCYVCADVEGSTPLWEANPDAMHEAIVLHDRIIRNCIASNHGYEVVNEGDAFQVIFHNCVDAVSFALDSQVALYNAQWNDDILALPGACDDSSKCMRGLRVRMALHHGTVTCRENEVSGRREYAGVTVNIAKCLESMAQGGQILASADVWNVASHVAATKLGSPKVVDHGIHVLQTGMRRNEGVIAKGVVELVPSCLAFDYSRCQTWRAREDQLSAGEVKGRQFPAIQSIRRLSASFYDAPHTGNVTVMAFLYTSEIEKLYDDPSMILAALTKQIGAMLNAGQGYQCKNFMLAFSTESEAVSFCLGLQEYLEDHCVLDSCLAGLLKIGVHRGPFTWMGPNQTTGRADYFGKVVNRAARVAGAAEPGQVYLGVPDKVVPELDDSLQTYFIGYRMLKGVQEELALYRCSRFRTRI